jgi:hypothetical protein
MKGSVMTQPPLATLGEPLACDLDALAPAEREQQAATFEQLRQQVLAVEELADGWAVQLPTAASTLLLAARFIENERRCCPFFDFTLHVTPDAGPIWLRITGRPGVKDFLAGAFAPGDSHD